MSVNIKTIFKLYNISLKTSQIDLFEKFLKLFIEKNSQINLSAIRDEIWVIEKHFVDSIILNNFIKLDWKVLDIWTGWGFPGIPLAITNEDVEFIWLDSTRKKIDAVNEFAAKLGLNNIKWIWDRAEELVKNEEYFQKFDFVVSRATAYLPDIINYSLPFLKWWWFMIFYKLYNESELIDWEKYMKEQKIFLTSQFEYKLLWQKRIIYIIKKI